MELTFNRNVNLTKPKNKFGHWNDSLIENFYLDYYRNLSSKELDKEFNNDIKTLTTTLSKLDDTERKAFIELLSIFIEFYLENKIEKEIDNSLFKILKF